MSIKKKHLNEHTNLKFKNKPKENFCSIIIPVYKDALGLRDTLLSLNKQSICKDKFEIIVANDGGNKGVTEVCLKHGVKVININPNMGSYFARNRGIEYSKGEYIAFLDADIMVPPNWLQNGMESLVNFDYVGGNVIIDESKINTLTDLYEAKTAFDIKKYIKKAHFGVTANLFVKREVFDELGGFEQRLYSGGDLEFGNRIYNFSYFKQEYEKKITVVHPPRGYKNFVKKFKRISKGHNDLINLYPDRFLSLKKNTKELIKEIVTPSKRADIVYDENYKYNHLTVFFYCWWFKIIEYYCKLRYVNLDNSNSGIQISKNYCINYINSKR